MFKRGLLKTGAADGAIEGDADGDAFEDELLRNLLKKELEEDPELDALPAACPEEEELPFFGFIWSSRSAREATWPLSISIRRSITYFIRSILLLSISGHVNSKRLCRTSRRRRSDSSAQFSLAVRRFLSDCVECVETPENEETEAEEGGNGEGECDGDGNGEGEADADAPADAKEE